MSSTVRLIQFRAAYNLPVHVGIDRGIFAAHGITVEAEYTPGSAYLMEAVRLGRFDLGHAAIDDVVADVEDYGTSDVFAFMGLHSGLLSLVGAPGCSNVASLRGKPLAVDARHSGFVFILEKILRDHGFRPEDYELVEVGGWERRYESLVAGECYGTLLTEPFVGYALEKGCQLIARGDELMPLYQATAGVARRSWARENAATLVHYIRAYVLATRSCFDPENRRHCLELLEKRNRLTGMAAGQTLDALVDPVNGMYRDAALNLPGTRAVLELRADMGFLNRPLPPVDKYIDTSYYEEAVSGM